MLPDVAGRAALALVLLGLVAAASLRARRAGTALPFTPRLAHFPPHDAGAPMTAYVFTSRLCHECHETPALVAAAAPGVPLVELPVERHAALARRLGVDETPTLFLVDEQGRVRFASRGNPAPEALRAALAREGQAPTTS